MVTLVQAVSGPKARTLQLCLRRIAFMTLISGGLALSGCVGSLATNKVQTDAAAGTLVASSSTVDFGAVAVGRTVSLSVTVVNQGSAPVTISGLNLSGQSFSTSAQSGLPATVNANGSFTLTVQFNPTATGATTGQLTVTSNSSTGTSISVGLSGTGVPVLSALTCASGSITGAGIDTCTVTLNSQADSGGVPVSLASSNLAMTVPVSVLVPAGATSTTFSASVSPVASTQAATLTASVGGVAQTFAVQLGAALPALGISAPSLAFGSVPVNSPATQPLILSSTGNSAVTVSAAALLGTGFSIAGGSLPVTLAPGQTATLTVQFDPATAGATTGQLTLTSDSLTGSTTSISLSGTGVPGLSGLSCTRTAISGTGTDRCTVTLSTAAGSGGFVVNLASSDSLVSVPATAIVATGATTASFTASVSPASSVDLVTLTASAGGVSQIFTLQLNPAGPALTLSSTNVNFGDVAVNTPAAQALILSSTGTSAVTINSAALSGTGFTASGATFPLTLDPNQTATVTLKFNPTATGSVAGQFTLNSNSVDGSSKRVALAGRGVPVLSTLSCASGSITGAGTDSCTVTLSAAAISGGLTISLGSNNSAVTVPATVSVPAGASSASFRASVSAVSVAQAVTLSASAGGITKTAGLQLGASVITLGLSTTNLAFGNENVNTAATLPVTLTSTGAAAVTISAATVAGSGFTVSGASFPLTLNPNQTATLSVQFDPAVAGTATGQLTLTSNSSTGSSTLVGLSGTGVPVLSGVSCSSGSMTATGTDSCTVTLNAAAASGAFAVSLASNSSAVAVPATVSVPAGANSANFTATVSSVSPVQTATLTAIAGGLSKTFALQLGAAAPVLSGVGCSSASMTATGTDSCTVTLNVAAPSGGFAVNLTSSSTAVAVPSAVTVPSGAISASFTATVSSVSTTQTVTLTASASNVTKTFALQLGAGVPTLSINATTLAFGTVKLNASATQSVTLSSTGTTAVTVSAAAVIGSGFTLSGAGFPLTLSPNQTATISVQFDPIVTGAATGTLTVVSTSLTNPTSVIALSGTGETASSGTPGEVDLTWDAPASSPDPVSGYNVYRSPSNAYSFVQLNSSIVTQTTYVDSAAQSGQSYDYIVESVDASGVTSAPTNIATVAVP